MPASPKVDKLELLKMNENQVSSIHIMNDSACDISNISESSSYSSLFVASTLNKTEKQYSQQGKISNNTFNLGF